MTENNGQEFSPGVTSKKPGVPRGEGFRRPHHVHFTANLRPLRLELTVLAPLVLIIWNKENNYLLYIYFRIWQPLCDFHLSLHSLLKSLLTIKLETACAVTPRLPFGSCCTSATRMAKAGFRLPTRREPRGLSFLSFSSAPSLPCSDCLTPQKPSTLIASANQYL